jgi:hypothetical protein
MPRCIRMVGHSEGNQIWRSSRSSGTGTGSGLKGIGRDFRGARFQIIDAGYFRTIRLPLIAGRAFETSDADESRGVAIVSETFARRLG